MAPGIVVSGWADGALRAHALQPPVGEPWGKLALENWQEGKWRRKVRHVWGTGVVNEVQIVGSVVQEGILAFKSTVGV